MKKQFLIIGLLFSSFLSAGTWGLISGKESAVIVVQGVDSDAKNLYSSMLSKPIVNRDGLLVKKIMSPSSQLSFVCSYTKLADTYSCTIKVKSGSVQTRIDSRNKTVFIEFLGSEGDELFNNFKRSLNNSSFMYATENQRLILLGKNDNFSLQYKGAL